MKIYQKHCRPKANRFRGGVPRGGAFACVCRFVCVLCATPIPGTPFLDLEVFANSLEIRMKKIMETTIRAEGAGGFTYYRAPRYT